MQYLPGSQSAEARLSFLTQNLYWKASASKLPARWNSLLLELPPFPECCQLPSENSLPGQPSEGDSSAYEPAGHLGLVVTVTDNEYSAVIIRTWRSESLLASRGLHRLQMHHNNYKHLRQIKGDCQHLERRSKPRRTKQKQNNVDMTLLIVTRQNNMDIFTINRFTWKANMRNEATSCSSVGCFESYQGTRHRTAHNTILHTA